MDSELNINFGSEFTFNRMFYIQVGNQLRKDSYFTPTFGAGLTYNNHYSLYYSFSAPSEIGFSHRIGIKFEFGSISSSKYVPRSTKISVKAPTGLSVKITNGNIFISWESMPNTYYNVYAKNAENRWIKLTKSPIKKNYLALKNPTSGKQYTITITALKDGTESAYAKEVVLNVKK